MCNALIEPLHSVLRTLHRLTGSPSACAIADVVGDGLTPEQVAELLEGTCMPDLSSICHSVQVLDVGPAFFRPLWEATRLAIAHLEGPRFRLRIVATGTGDGHLHLRSPDHASAGIWPHAGRGSQGSLRS